MNNAVNSVSRVLMGILADRVGRQNTMVASVRTRLLIDLAFVLILIEPVYRFAGYTFRSLSLGLVV
jgi:nitrate/nitrite transporter NarK